jgi:hypothetical protein
VVVAGRVDVNEASAHGFAPRGLKGWNIVYVPTNPEFWACADCGLVWSNVVANALAGFLEHNLGPLGMECYRALRGGAAWDLPDSDQAHAAAEAVLEINRLVLLDKRPEATRRYRELTGCSWDDANDAIAGWKKLQRAIKLARFGWVEKDKEGRLEGAHPMHDRLLDG